VLASGRLVIRAGARTRGGRHGNVGLLEHPVHAPGMPYSYGPPTTVGRWSKLKIGGGEATCHSSVSAFHGFAPARGPPRHEAIML